ncbi:hypothetical protein M8J75_006980 [Diaphorina citri]|nr:hypothetical protein M8J75_006980 [Diaphorina citri]
MLKKLDFFRRSSSKDSTRSSLSSDDLKPHSSRTNDDLDLLDLPHDGASHKRNSFILNDWEIIREALRHTDNANALTKELECTIRDVHQFLLALENDHLLLSRNDKLTPDVRKAREDKLKDKILVAKDILHKLKLYNILDKASSCDTGKFRDNDDSSLS